MLLYDVFLSHASVDKPEVEHLARKLEAAGLKPFFEKLRQRGRSTRPC